MHNFQAAEARPDRAGDKSCACTPRAARLAGTGNSRTSAAASSPVAGAVWMP